MNGINSLQMDKVYPNPDQPRKDFDPDRLEELSMSIKEYGVLEPIVVTPRGNRYMIIAGERRYRASYIAELTEIPARVIEADDALVEELALLENIQRQDLNIIEEARAFQSLLDRGWSEDKLAKKMGFKQVWRIKERTSLLNLAPEFQDMVTGRGSFTLGNSQAFEVSRLPQAKQRQVVNKILAGELNTYNKLRAFVDAVIEIENQGDFFALQQISESEKETIDTFNSMLRSVERFIKQGYDQDKTDYLKKAGYRQDIKVERLDLIIQELQKIRKVVLAGKGIKDALAA